jgi:hypothetical protein
MQGELMTDDFPRKGPWAVVIVAFLAIISLSSCTAAEQLLGGPTPIPLAQRDLSLVVLRKSDLASEFASNPGKEGADAVEGIFENSPEVHTNLVAAHQSFFLRSAYPVLSFTSGVFVYESEEHAKQALASILLQDNGEAVEVPRIGSESAAYKDTSMLQDLPLYESFMTWQYREAVAFVGSFGMVETATDEMVRLARIMQARLEGAE